MKVLVYTLLTLLIFCSCNKKLSRENALNVLDLSVALPQEWQVREIALTSKNPLIIHNLDFYSKLAENDTYKLANNGTYLLNENNSDIKYIVDYKNGGNVALAKSHFPLSYTISTIYQEKDEDTNAEVYFTVEYGVSPFFIAKKDAGSRNALAYRTMTEEEHKGLNYGHWFSSTPIKCQLKKYDNGWKLEDVEHVKQQILNPFDSYFF